MSMIQEFKKFAMRGNVVDLAVGVIIGAAFGAIVNSLVGDLVMPMIGLATSGIDFSKAAIVLQDASVDGKTPAVLLSYGKFLQVVFNFAIISFVVFLVVKGINKVHKKEEAAAPPTPTEALLAEIRDLLKNQK